MKQKQIKKDRFYRNRKSKRYRYVRNVDSVTATDQTYVWWVEVLPSGAIDTLVHSQLLKSFARWAGAEIRPVFDEVRRCPKCDHWEWKDHLPATDSMCRKCGTLIQSEHDY